MSNLQDISIDKIETDVMSVLYANMNVTFTQHSLFDKVLIDKYDGKYTPNSIFKSKFFIVLGNLMEKYDDIKITKKNQIFSIVCVSNPDNPSKMPNDYWSEHIPYPIKLDNKDIGNMYDYIYDNNLVEYIEKRDPWDSNTIYHNLVLCENSHRIEQLVQNDQFDFFAKNKYEETPLELIGMLSTPNSVGKILINGLECKINSLNKKILGEQNSNKLLIEKYNTDMKYFKSPEYSNTIIENTNLSDIIKIKISQFYSKYFLHIIFVLAVSIYFILK
jgi:hypothetical protein